MSKESSFEITYILTGFFSLEILQEPEVLENGSAEIVRFAIPSKFWSININLHFWRLEVKDYIFRRLTVKFRPFDGWWLTPLRPSIGSTELFHGIVQNFFYSFFGRGLTHNESPKINESGNFPPFTIPHFHINHNAPCLPRRILHNHCFQYLLGITVVPGQIEVKGYAELLGVNNVHLGLYENGEFRTTGCPRGGRTSWQTCAHRL